MRGRYATLDGLRGIAALAVLGVHCVELTTGGHTVPSAAAAVDFFFLLSGFVLAHAYPRPGVAYLRDRAIRLYPMILLGAATGAVLLLSSGHSGERGITLALNLVGLPAGSSLYPFDWPLWSIAFEAVLSVAYLFAARLNTYHIAALVVVLAMLNPQPFVYWGWGALLRAAFPFAVGVLLQRLPAPKLDARSAVWSAGLLAFALVVWPVPHLAQVLAFAAILTLGRAQPPEVAAPAANLLGRISYPLYALHWPICWWVARHFTGTGVVVALSVVGSLSAAYLAARFYDEPVRRWLMRATSARPRVAIPVIP